MTGKTHIAAGIITGELVALYARPMPVETGIFIICAAAVGSLLPDIDHPQSTIARKNAFTKTLSESMAAVGKHRGFTHTTVFVALMTFLLGLLLRGRVNAWALITMSFCAGQLSHLFMDTLNAKGIMWFWPISPKALHIMSIRTGSKVETAIRLPINAAATVLLGYLGYDYLVAFGRTKGWF